MVGEENDVFWKRKTRRIEGFQTKKTGTRTHIEIHIGIDTQITTTTTRITSRLDHAVLWPSMNAVPTMEINNSTKSSGSDLFISRKKRLMRTIMYVRTRRKARVRNVSFLIVDHIRIFWLPFTSSVVTCVDAGATVRWLTIRTGGWTFGARVVAPCIGRVCWKNEWIEDDYLKLFEYPINSLLFD